MVRVRGVLTGLLCAWGAVVAHLLAGGTVVPVAAVAAVGLSVPLCVVLTTRQVRTERIAAAALLTQGAWHLLFGMGSTGMGSSPAGEHALPMLAGHLVVATATVALAVEAERSLLRLLVRLVASAVLPVLGALPVLPRRRALSALWDIVLVRSLVDVSVHPRRGPPVFSAPSSTL